MAIGRRHLAPCVLGVLAFAVYLTNLRPMGSNDTIPARLLPFSLLREGNLDLDEFQWLHPGGLSPYFLRQDAAGHWRSRFPITTPVVVTPVAAPFVWWSRAWDIKDEDARFRLVVAIFDRVAAALLTALSVVAVFIAATRLAPASIAMAVAAAYAFGTNTWVTSSQSLWQHALAELSIAGAAACALSGQGMRTAFLAGIFAGLAVSARPPAVIGAAAIAVFFWRERRGNLRAFLAGPVVMATLLLTYNLTIFRRATGGYAGRGFGLPGVERFLGLLFSPSRGLFVYCPLAALAIPALRRPIEGVSPALRYLAFAVVGYVLLFTCFHSWWAGYSYGPRYFTDVMPLVALCAVPAARRLWTYGPGRVLLVAGLLWCVGVQLVGVYCDDNEWNWWPESVDQRTERLWNLADTQIVRAARSGWHGSEFAPLLHQLLVDANPALLVPLDPSALRATIESLASTPWHFRAGSGGWIDVRVVNRSEHAVWPAFSDFGTLEVGLLVVWKSGGAAVPGVGGFRPFRRHLGPGASVHVRQWVEAPRLPGAYELDLNVVQNLGNSGRFGGASLTVPVAVE